MLDHLIKFILSQRLLVIIATAMLCVGGTIAWKYLPIDAFPDVTNVQVMVLTEASGLSPADVEQQITVPIELTMQGLPSVKQFRSTSKSGLSQVIIVFEDNVDIYFARQLIFERLQTAREGLPEWAEPEMGPISTGLGEIYQYTLESDTLSPMELRTIQDWIVAPQLRVIPGVNEVNSFGGFVKQYHILINPNKLTKYGITLDKVLEALESNNANAGGNYIMRGWEQAYVRNLGLIRSIADIENIVLKAEDGAPVFLKEVAEVKIGPQTRQGAVTRDGKGERVAGMVIMLRGSNSKIVVDAVKKAIPAIQAGLPKDVRISTFYDRTSLIQACIKTVADALLVGGILVIAVLFLLLGNIRVSLIVALSLSLSAFVAFILMGWRGLSANLMSLGGLAIALGMVVDASIVVAENVSRHLAERAGSGIQKTLIVGEALREVARPVIFAILIIVIVFFPLFTLEQMEGKMFKPLALAICFAMLGSLLVALTVVPVFCSLFIREKKEEREHFALLKIKQVYLPVLALALKRKRATVWIALALFILSLGFAPFIGTEFLPALDEGSVAVNLVRLPTASLDGSVAVGTFIEQQLAKYQEIAAVVTKTGRAEISEDPMGPEQNDIFIMLRPRKEWKSGRTKAELVEAIKTDIAKVPGVRPSFSQPIALRVNELISGVKSDVAVKLFGPDLEVMRENANKIAALMGEVRGAEDVKVEQISGFVQIEIEPDRQTIARYRINMAGINEAIETAVGGSVATTVIEGQMRFAALVRFPEEYRNSIAAMERLLIHSPEGLSIPLGQLAKIREAEAPAQISRENGMRRVVVECNIRGRDMGGFVEEVRNKIKGVQASLPPGYYLQFGGQFENQQRAMRKLAVVVPISIGLIFLMLFSALGSIRHALLVLANLPFALAGGILSIVLLKITLSVSTAVGFIALFGIAVQNGTVLVAFFNQLREQGLGIAEAVRKGCELRVRPLLMTSLCAFLGLLPMIFSAGSGSEIQRPLAAVVLGGLITSLLLTLIILPALYCLVENWREQRKAVQ